MLSAWRSTERNQKALRVPPLIALTAVMMAVQVQLLDFATLVNPIMTDLSLSYTQVGFIQTSLFIPYTLLQPLAGLASDRYSPRKVVVVSALISTAASLAFAYSQNFAEVFVTRAIAGCAMAFTFVPCIKYILGSTSSKRHGRTLGVFSTGLTLGSIVAAIGPPLLSGYGGWRIAIAMLSLLALVAALALVNSDPGHLPSAAGSPLSELSGVVRRKEVWILSYNNVMRYGVAVAVSTWMPTFLIKSHGFSTVDSGIVLSAVWGFSLVGAVGGGYASDKTGRRFPFIELEAFGLLFAFMWIATTSDYSTLWLSSAMLGLAMSLNFGPVFSSIPRVFEKEFSGAATGIVSSAASGSAFVLPAVIGFLKDSTGSFDDAWYLLAAMAAVAAVVSLGLRRYDTSKSRVTPNLFAADPPRNGRLSRSTHQRPQRSWRYRSLDDVHSQGRQSILNGVRDRPICRGDA